MPRTIQTTVYTFDELSDKAKVRARDWYRSASQFDSDCVIEDACEIAEYMGLDIRQRAIKTALGSTKRWRASIYWSGFSSQGDGACFDGHWKACDWKNNTHWSNDAQLDAIHAVFHEVAQAYPDSFFMVKHRGHYVHENCTEFTFSDDVAAIDEARLIKATRDFMRWIYRALEREYDYQNEDAQVEELIIANGYEFTKDGVRA